MINDFLIAILIYQNRFWKKVEIKSSEECWEWKGITWPNGYGAFDMHLFGIKSGLTHRLSWMFHHGKIPDGICVCHKCDNKKCVNPDHLFLGTHQDNMDDIRRKKRHANTIKRECPKGHEYSGFNLIVDKRGYRRCRTCKLASGARERIKKRSMLTTQT